MEVAVLSLGGVPKPQEVQQVVCLLEPVAIQAKGGFDEAMLTQGAVDRLNAIVMTALLTAMVLVPLAMQAGESGNEIQSPMAVVILGGLISATVLNLFVMPARYSMLSRPALASGK